MIYTVTLNPSLDYIVRLDAFAEGTVNRADYEAIVAGGKGINVSVMLRALGVESMALGFIAGFTGEEIRRLVREMGCKEEFLMLKNGFSRINIKMKTRASESEVNGAGPLVSEEELHAFMESLDALESGDMLVLSGSVPKSVPKTIYCDIASRMEGKGVLLIADASGSLLSDILPYKPFLVKPNHHELGTLFGTEIHTSEDAIFYAKKLQTLGAQNVLVSMAGDGAVLISEEGRVYTASAPKGNVINSVGAGDSMVAGFLAGYLEKDDMEYALSVGIAAGSASAFSEGIASYQAVKTLMNAMKKES